MNPAHEVFDESLERALLDESLNGARDLIGDLKRGFHARLVINELKERSTEFHVFGGDMEMQLDAVYSADAFHLLGQTEGYDIFNSRHEVNRMKQRDGQKHKYIPNLPTFFFDSRKTSMLHTAGKYTPISQLR